MFSPRIYKVCLLVSGALECLCFGGWIFGWASLVFVLKQEGYFADRCPASSTAEPSGWTVNSNDSTTNASQRVEPELAGCAEQDAELTLVFTVANFCVSGVALPLGLLYDRMGTLFMRILISILMLAGSLMFALSSSATAILVFPAAICIAMGGVQILVVNLQISNLFGRSKWIVMTIFCGCFDSSAWVFLVVKVLYETYGIPVQTTFFVLTGTTLVFIINTVFLLPKKASIPWPLPADYWDNNLGLRRKSKPNTAEPMHVYSNDITDTEGKYYPKCSETNHWENVEGIQTTDDEKGPDGPAVQRENGFPPALQRDTDAAEDDNVDPVPQSNGLLHRQSIDFPSKSPPDCPIVGRENGYPPALQKDVDAPEDEDFSPAPLSKNSSYRQPKDFPSLGACILSATFVFFYLWFSVLQLDVLFFVSTLNPVLTRLANGDEQIVSAYTNAQAFFQLGGILCAPFSGLILSRNKRRNRCKNREKEAERLRQRGPYSDLKDAALAYAVSTSICIAFCVCALLPVLEVQYATFALSVCSRSFVYSLMASGTALFFPMEYFGTIYGLMIMSSAVFSLLQYPLFIVTQDLLDNNDFWVKIGLLSATVLTYSLSIFIFFYVRRKEKLLKQEKEATGEGVEDSKETSVD